jgi:hypothetical protein
MGSSQRDGKASGQELWRDLQRNAEARGSGGVGVVTVHDKITLGIADGHGLLVP